MTMLVSFLVRVIIVHFYKLAPVENVRVTNSSRFVIIKLTFAARVRYSLLWPEATTCERSKRDYLWLDVALVRYERRPQHF